MVKAVTAYEAKDGEHFKTPEDCIRHEIGLDLDAVYVAWSEDKEYDECRDCTQFVKDNWDAIKALMEVRRAS